MMVWGLMSSDVGSHGPVSTRIYSRRIMTEFRSCVRVEVAVLGSPSLISLMVSVDVKHHVYLLRETIQSSGGV